MNRRRLSRAHRLLGLLALVPLAGWIVSSFVLHGVALALPNGLQGVYELEPYHAAGLPLEGAGLLPPDSILRRVAADGLDRVYWLRLEPLGGAPAYVVKPGPFDLERVYDARSGRRLDPLDDDALRRIGDAELVGTTVEEVHEGNEFNRYYAMDEVPAGALRMTGAQPSEVVLSRASGRTLRRTDPGAEAFEKAYRSVHVWQWGDALRFFTALLYTLVGLTLTLVVLGYVLWFDRRDRRTRWGPAVRKERRLHARVAPVAGLILSTQMLVGAYLWFNLGLIEPRFRGQGSFAAEWEGGIATTESLAPAEVLAAAVPDSLRPADGRPFQRFEWRAPGPLRTWVAYPRRDADGVLLEAGSGRVVGRLTPEQAAGAGAGVVLGAATGAGVESTEYWMDYNTRVPTYRFRFSDPDDSDVHVSQVTGEVVQRRPAIWRAFGPFLVYHTFGFTGNPWLDTALLTALQVTILIMMVSGWRLAFPRKAGVDPEAVAESA